MMTEAKRGRPPLDAHDRTVPVSLGIPKKQFERVCAEARRESVSVPEYIRQAIQTKIAK